MGLFGPKCNHEWEVINEMVSKSPVEREPRLESIEGPDARDMFLRTVIQIVTCKKCGKLKRYVTKV